MSLYRWRHIAVFGAALLGACGGSNEAGTEHAATKAQALVVAVPGRIEAESYGRALDSTPDVNFGAYVTQCDRKDGVDIDRSDDPDDGGCAIGWTTAGEWLEYDIQASATKVVDITARVASDLLDRQFHVSIDGTGLAEQSLPSLGTWRYTNVTYSGVTLSAGAHVLRFTFDSDSIDLNYIDVTPSGTAPLVETLLPATGAVASSVESDALPASLVIDGDSTTRWSSQFSDPQWIYVDLGKVRQVSRVILNWEVAASQTYEIGVSDRSDGPWSVVYSTTTGDGGLDDISFAPMAARYVRLYSTARLTYFGNSLYDFDVYGEVAPDPSCTPEIADAPDDGAQIEPQPALSPSFVAPYGSSCGGQCLNGSVLDKGTLAARSAPVWMPDGTVLIFVKGPDGTWPRQAVIANPEAVGVRSDPYSAAIDRTFGTYLALNGDELLSSGTANGVGKVYLFTRSGGVWRLKQTLLVNADGRFVLDNGTALIRTAQGVRVFQRGADGYYRLQTVFDAPLDPVDAEYRNTFGSSVALDKNVAVVGAPPPGGYVTGHSSAVYIYERCSSLWSFAQRLDPPDGAVGTSFGSAVGVSGTQIAVSEPNAAGPSAQRTGAVQLYLREGSHWVADQRILNSILADGQYISFGTALALHNHLLLSSFVEPYPFAFGGYTTLFDVNGTPRLLAALGGSALTVQISGHEALVDVSARHYGTDPEVFELPK